MIRIPALAGQFFYAIGAFLVLERASAAEGVSPDSTDPLEIVRAVDARDGGDKQVATLHMTLTDKAGRSRERVLSTRSMKFDEGTRSVFVIESPEDVRGTGLLSVDYRAGYQADDQWLYLPSLHKATRIASSGKSGSFLGSDLTYADLTRQDLADYTYALVEPSVEVDGQDCWVVEARPANDRVSAETGYVKSLYWIRKDRLMPVQIKHWVAEGRRLKFLQFEDVEQVDGVWLAKRVVVRVVRDGEVESSTVLATRDVRFDDPSVTAEDFTPHRLEQGP